MADDPARYPRRQLITAAGTLGLGLVATGSAGAQDAQDSPRSRRISEEAVVGTSVVRSPDYSEAKKYSLIHVFEHVFQHDEVIDSGYPVTRTKDFTISPAVKLALVTMSGFEVWLGTTEQEYYAASSRLGVHAALEADFARHALTVKARANYRFWGKVDCEWTWRCHVVVHCHGEA